jgi:hypothetical protein
MRATWWLAAAAGLGLAGAARAQSAPTFGGSNDPVQFHIVSTDPKLPISSPQTMVVPTNPQRFFASSPGRINNTNVIGRSIFPTYEQLPNEEYLRAFRIQRHPRVNPPWYSFFWPWWRR